MISGDPAVMTGDHRGITRRQTILGVKRTSPGRCREHVEAAEGLVVRFDLHQRAGGALEDLHGVGDLPGPKDTVLGGNVPGAPTRNRLTKSVYCGKR